MEIESAVSNILEKSQSVIEDSNLKDYEEAKNEYANKLHQPEDLHDFFKSHMSITSKHAFEKGMRKIITDLYTNFCEKKTKMLYDEIVLRK